MAEETMQNNVENEEIQEMNSSENMESAVNAQTEDNQKKGTPDIGEIRRVLEEARERETEAYHALSQVNFTDAHREAIKLVHLNEVETVDRELAEEKCIHLLKNYYLPHIAKGGLKFKLADSFTRFDDPGQNYIEAVFTNPDGQTETVAYNYKLDTDNRSLIIFEKKFDNVVIKEGEPERYVLYDDNGEDEVASLSAEEMEELIADKEVVKVDDRYFLKAKDGIGRLIKGKTEVFFKESTENGSKTMLGNNEQETFSLNEQGQLVKSVTNDVTTVQVEKKDLPKSNTTYPDELSARQAAEAMLQSKDSNCKIEVFAEGTSSAKFSFVPVFTTIVDLSGVSKKIGKGLGEDFDPNLSDEQNAKNMFEESIIRYLNEKGYHVVRITWDMECEVKENNGMINNTKTVQIKSGKASVTYLKVQQTTVVLKQGILRNQKEGDLAPILAQLPGSADLLNPEEIDWKSTRPVVTYFLRGNAVGFANAKSVEQADEAAAEKAITEAQKRAASGLNGGIASGIKECLTATGAVSTVANALPRVDATTVTKEDMEISRQEVKYSFAVTYERETANVIANQLISKTVWNVKEIIYVAPSEPVIDRGIPSDENYDNYIEKEDESGILLFEKTDVELKRYLQDAQKAEERSAQLINDYRQAWEELNQAQKDFDDAFEI